MNGVKNIFQLFILSIFFIACNRDNIPQQIRQQINLYFQDKNGNDLLDFNAEVNYYRKIDFFDLNSEKADMPINSITYNKDNSNKNYIKYISGAKRSISENNENNKIYVSDFFITYNKHSKDTKVMDNDTLHVVYSSEPSIFRIQEIMLNRKKVYDTSSDTNIPNLVIVKH